MTVSNNTARNAIIGISVAVTALVVALFVIEPPKVDVGFDITILPLFHAIINGTTAVLLLLGLLFIKQKNITAHKTMMGLALGLSAIFLLSYVVYHSLSEPTTYGGEGGLKYFYYFILITHVILAAGVLPFILFTFFRALTGQFEKHKKIAKVTWPIWFYVAITGVLVYVLISPYY